MTKSSVTDRLAALRAAELPPGEEAAMLARIMQSPRTPLPGDLVGDERPSHARRTALLAGAGTVAVAAGSIGVALAVSSGGTPLRSNVPVSGLRLAAPVHPTGSTVGARLLSALTSANGDVIETTITFANGVQHDWSNGTNSRMVNTVPNAWPPERLITVGSSTTTFVGIYPATKTWTTVTKPTVQGTPQSAVDQIEAETGRTPFGPITLVAKGVTVDGQLTNEYRLPYDNGYLWVNASTYLPVRDASDPGSTDGETDWTYYAPTPAALSELTMPIPVDYTEVPSPAGATGLPHTLPLPTTSTSTSTSAAPATTAPPTTATAAPAAPTAPPSSTPAPTSASGAGTPTTGTGTTAPPAPTTQPTSTTAPQPTTPSGPAAPTTGTGSDA